MDGGEAPPVHRIRDGNLATRMRAAASEGELIVEAGGEQYVVVRLPRTIEVADREAAAESGGLRYTADAARALLRHEVAGERRRRPPLFSGRRGVEGPPCRAVADISGSANCPGAG